MGKIENQGDIPSKEVNSNKDSIDKLRDDLFDYRLDIKSYKNNLNTIIITGSILISILAFFGYMKIENIEKIILDKADLRLAKTDTLLSKIDQKKIDSLNNLLVTKEIEFAQTIINFEKIISQNQELENKLLKSLPENKRITKGFDKYISEKPTDVFIVRKPFVGELMSGETKDLYAIITENFEIDTNDYLSLTIYPKGRRMQLYRNVYEINSRLNKMTFGIEQFENHKDYIIEISLFKYLENDLYKNYQNDLEVTLK